MNMLALARADQIIWWITIGIGFVVSLVVIVLLSLLVALVDDIDRDVKILWNTATQLARNTATTWMLGQTATLTSELRDETNMHVRLLSSVNGGRR